MARPHKNTVNYFPHDSDASEGKTLTIIYNHFGHEGISCWWQLLERVSSTNNHVIDIRNPEDIEYLSAKLHLTPDRLKEILTKLADLNAIDSKLFSHGFIWSQNLVNRLEAVYKTRKQELPVKPVLNREGTELIIEETTNIISESTQSRDSRDSRDSIYIPIYDLWNSLKIITHKNITEDIKKKIDKVLKSFSNEDLMQAMKNYAEIVNSKEYYFNHKWTLAEFISRNNGNNIERFLDLETAKENYKGERNEEHKKDSRKLPKSGEYPEPKEF